MILPHFNSRTIVPTFTKFLQDVCLEALASVAINSDIYKAILHSVSEVWKATAKSEGYVYNLRPNTYHVVKNRENRFSIF